MELKGLDLLVGSLTGLLVDFCRADVTMFLNVLKNDIFVFPN